MPDEPTMIANPPELPARPESGHKGMFGRVLVVGGSDHMLGAPVMAATAALRCGAGLVEAALPREILPAALSVTPEIVGLQLGKTPDAEKLRQSAEAADALVIGPGMGQSRIAHLRLKALLDVERRAVLDADALNMLASGGAWPERVRLRAVLTPHPGEMSRLGPLFGVVAVPPDEAGRQNVAVRCARMLRQTVLLKGHHTVITDGERVYINQTGDSTLSKAGTGDILSGMIGCFLAQEMEPFEAACLGAHLHGLCGELAGRAHGRRYPVAMDLLDFLPEAFRRMRAE